MAGAALAVHARGLTKRFGALTAVDGIDLDVEVGASVGILGPNGAGKTTTMRMIAGTSPPTAGQLEVLGLDVRRHRRQLKRRIGVVPQGTTLDEDLRVRENLVVHGLYHDLPRREAERRADLLLEFAELSDRADAHVRELSGGMQRRLLVARALINEPELVLLDEPTTGLDPQARRLVWDRLRQLRHRGVTMLITTHYMEEAARLCDRVVVIDRGRIIAAGAPDELVRRHVPPRVVEVEGTSDVEAARRALDGAARLVEVVGDRVVAYGEDGDAIVARIRQAQVPHSALITRDATLEDVFLLLAGHQLRD